MGKLIAHLRMSSQAPCRAASLLALVFTISGISIAQGQYLRSPCPDIFTYQVDPNTKQIFGYVEIDNIQVGQTVKLNIDLSIAAPVPQVSSNFRIRFQMFKNV